ncbi:MAG: tetratricopeptide repeat protein [Verrucomicrobiota bacterium]|jgi:TolA-binding protein|nr:tetratricopeptide repeat protein [Verrucomicrobiota bacterium]
MRNHFQWIHTTLRASAVVACLLSGSAYGLTAEEQIRFADGIYLRGFHETAVGEYLVLLRDFPESPHVPAALYRIGESYRQMGNQVGAERFYKRVVVEFPDSPQAARAELRRAELALEAERYAEAEALLRSLLAAAAPAETATAALYYLGFGRWKTGDVRGAQDAYEQVLADDDVSPYASYAALDLAAMYADSKKHQKQMPGWFEQAVGAAGTPEGRAEALFRWGDWAYRRGEYQTAADTLQALLVEGPDTRRARDARLALAWSLYYLERPSEALEWAERLEKEPGDPETMASALYLRANALRKMNRDGEALNFYRQVVHDHPASPFAPRAAYEIMVTHFKRGEDAKTLAAAPVNPGPENEADVLWMRAESERRLRNLDAARGLYETVAARFPKSDSAASSLLRLGELAREAGRLEEAAEWFDRVATEYPAHAAAPEALKAAALARLRAGDAEGALANLNSLLVRKPGDEVEAEARLQKALVLMDLNRPSEAGTVLNELVRKNADSLQTARAHYWRGVLDMDREEWNAAEKAFRSSLAATPDAQTASLARLRLAMALQRQDRMDEAADQVEQLLAFPERVAENPALVEWLIRHRFGQEQVERALQAADALAAYAADASWRQMAWYWMGICRSELGEEAAAGDAFEKAVAEPAKTREGAEARLLLAALELKAGRPEQAAARYAAAAAAATDENTTDLRVRAYFGLGEAAEAAGRPEQAAKQFMSVAVLYDDPEWTPHALYRAGLLFGALGRTAEQESVWRELKSRYADSGFARQVEAMPR